MTKKLLTSLKLVNLASDPLVGSEGELYFNTSSSVAKIYKNGAWSELGAGGGGGGGGTGITISETAPGSPTSGDLWYQASTGSLSVWDGTYWVEINGVVTGTQITVSEYEPATKQEGDLWFNNVLGEFYIYDGTYWVDVSSIISNPPLTEDQVQDYVAPLFVHNDHTNVTATYDDANNKIILNTSASITNIDSIVYPDYITFDTTPETSASVAGTMFWDSGDAGLRILSSNSSLLIGQQQYALVKNATGSSIPKGSVVYINGAQGQRPTVTLSSASAEVTSSKTFGFLSETIADGAEGLVTTEGILRGVNTDGLTEGGALWLSTTSGQYTQTMPTQPNHGVFLGYVVKAHASSGEIYVKIQNGYELNELHNVLINGLADNDLLAYDLSSGLWKNQNASAANLLDLNTASATYLTQTSASTTYATKVSVDAIADITPLDNIKSQFNGIQTRFLPTYLGDTVLITNPYRLLLNINGIIQVVDYPELVWQSPLPRQGYWIDNDGYIVFSEAPPPGSTFDARIMAGSTTTTKTKLLYPFEAVDILLGE